MKRVIINADDLGISKGTNQAIIKAYKDGILTSASLMANMPGYEDAVKNVIPNHPGLGIGIHLSLTIGKSVLPPSKIPLLVEESGYFKNSFFQFYQLIRENRNALLQIHDELDAQIAKIYSEKVEIDHINSQHHVHMIPPIFDVVVNLSMKYGCKQLRLSEEAFVFDRRFPLGYYVTPLINGNWIKKTVLSRFAKRNKQKLAGFQITDYFLGVLHTSNMGTKILKKKLESVKCGVTEILTHPGFYSSPESDEWRSDLLEKFLRSQKRKVEFEALVDDSVRDVVEKNNIVLIRFSDMKGFDSSLSDSPRAFCDEKSR